MMETLNKIKLAVVGIAGAITAVFGWMGWLVIGFAACMLLDWITGSVAGSKKDGWSSAAAFSQMLPSSVTMYQHNTSGHTSTELYHTKNC